MQATEEELKSINEGLQSMNEEPQTLNHELGKTRECIPAGDQTRREAR